MNGQSQVLYDRTLEELFNPYLSKEKALMAGEIYHSPRLKGKISSLRGKWSRTTTLPTPLVPMTTDELDELSVHAASRPTARLHRQRAFKATSGSVSPPSIRSKFVQAFQQQSSPMAGLEEAEEEASSAVTVEAQDCRRILSSVDASSEIQLPDMNYSQVYKTMTLKERKIVKDLKRMNTAAAHLAKKTASASGNTTTRRKPAKVQKKIKSPVGAKSGKPRSPHKLVVNNAVTNPSIATVKALCILDSFLLIGPDLTDLIADASIENKMPDIVQPQISWSYPPLGPSHIEMAENFCFPRGIPIHVSSRNAQGHISDIADTNIFPEKDYLFFVYLISGGGKDGSEIRYACCMYKWIILPVPSLASSSVLRVPICYCMITQTPFLSFFQDMLRQLLTAFCYDFETTDSNNYELLSSRRHQYLVTALQSLSSTPVPRIGQRLSLADIFPDQLRPFVLARLPVEDHTDESAMLTLRWGLPILLHHLTPKILFDLLGYLTLEMRVLVVAQDVQALTATVLSLAALLRPFRWAGPLVAILPPTLHEYIEAPVPYLLGIQSVPSHFVLNQGTVLVSVDDNRILLHPQDHPDRQNLHLPQVATLHREVASYCHAFLGLVKPRAPEGRRGSRSDQEAPPDTLDDPNAAQAKARKIIELIIRRIRTHMQLILDTCDILSRDTSNVTNPDNVLHPVDELDESWDERRALRLAIGKHGNEFFATLERAQLYQNVCDDARDLNVDGSKCPGRMEAKCLDARCYLHHRSLHECIDALFHIAMTGKNTSTKARPRRCQCPTKTRTKEPLHRASAYAHLRQIVVQDQRKSMYHPSVYFPRKEPRVTLTPVPLKSKSPTQALAPKPKPTEKNNHAKPKDRPTSTSPKPRARSSTMPSIQQCRPADSSSTRLTHQASTFSLVNDENEEERAAKQLQSIWRVYAQNQRQPHDQQLLLLPRRSTTSTTTSASTMSNTHPNAQIMDSSSSSTKTLDPTPVHATTNTSETTLTHPSVCSTARADAPRTSDDASSSSFALSLEQHVEQHHGEGGSSLPSSSSQTLHAESTTRPSSSSSSTDVVLKRSSSRNQFFLHRLTHEGYHVALMSDFGRFHKRRVLVSGGRNTLFTRRRDVSSVSVLPQIVTTTSDTSESELDKKVFVELEDIQDIWMTQQQPTTTNNPETYVTIAIRLNDPKKELLRLGLKDASEARELVTGIHARVEMLRSLRSIASDISSLQASAPLTLEESQFLMTFKSELRAGVCVTKHGRRGKPHEITLRSDANFHTLEWTRVHQRWSLMMMRRRSLSRERRDNNNRIKSVAFLEIVRLVPGRQTERKVRGCVDARLCFSIIIGHDRTLDLETKTSEEYHRLFHGLKLLHRQLTLSKHQKA